MFVLLGDWLVRDDCPLGGVALRSSVAGEPRLPLPPKPKLSPMRKWPPLSAFSFLVSAGSVDPPNLASISRGFSAGFFSRELDFIFGDSAVTPFFDFSRKKPKTPPDFLVFGEVSALALADSSGRTMVERFVSGTIDSSSTCYCNDVN